MSWILLGLLSLSACRREAAPASSTAASSTAASSTAASSTAASSTGGAEVEELSSADAMQLRAVEAHRDGQYDECARLYREVAALTLAARQTSALSNAAGCSARAGKIDEAFAALEEAVRKAPRWMISIEDEPDFENLRGDVRWAKLVYSAHRDLVLWEQTLRAAPLRRELLALVERDQEARQQVLDAGAAADADAVAAGEAMVADVDRQTTARMKEIVAEHGWPGVRAVGGDGAHAAWLLVQHAEADVAFQKQCLALMEPLLATDEVSAIGYAYLYDRVAVAERRPQRYGTQLDARHKPHPIEDEAHVDSRRIGIGLPSMAVYRRQMAQIQRMQAAPLKEQ